MLCGFGSLLRYLLPSPLFAKAFSDQTEQRRATTCQNLTPSTVEKQSEMEGKKVELVHIGVQWTSQPEQESTPLATSNSVLESCDWVF